MNNINECKNQIFSFCLLVFWFWQTNYTMQCNFRLGVHRGHFRLFPSRVWWFSIFAPDSWTWEILNPQENMLNSGGIFWGSAHPTAWYILPWNIPYFIRTYDSKLYLIMKMSQPAFHIKVFPFHNPFVKFSFRKFLDPWQNSKNMPSIKYISVPLSLLRYCQTQKLTSWYRHS